MKIKIKITSDKSQRKLNIETLVNKLPQPKAKENCQLPNYQFFHADNLIGNEYVILYYQKKKKGVITKKIL